MRSSPLCHLMLTRILSDPRHILCGGGAMVFSAMMASLLGGSKPVRAQTIAGSVPEVDRVSIRVVVDSYQFAVAAGKKVGLALQHCLPLHLKRSMPYAGFARALVLPSPSICFASLRCHAVGRRISLALTPPPLTRGCPIGATKRPPRSRSLVETWAVWPYCFLLRRRRRREAAMRGVRFFKPGIATVAFQRLPAEPLM